MKLILRFFCLSSFIICSSFNTNAQSDSATYKMNRFRAHKPVVSLHVPIAIGKFSATHLGGVGVDFSMEFNKENRLLNFLCNAGAIYYLGKRETFFDYSYQYPGFTFIHLMGGTHLWVNDVNIRLMAGPAIGIYNGNTEFNIGSRLEANFSLGRSFLIGPTLNMMLEPGTTSLWAAGIRIGFGF